MRGALSVAHLTVLGFVRRGMLWLLLAQAAAVAVALWMVPVLAEDRHGSRLRVVLLVGTEAAVILATLLAACGAGTAIPADMVSRRLHLVLARPCARGGVVVGRFLGYGAGMLLLHAAWLLLVLCGVLLGRLGGGVAAEQTRVQVPVPAVRADVFGPTVLALPGEEVAEDHSGHDHGSHDHGGTAHSGHDHSGAPEPATAAAVAGPPMPPAQPAPGDVTWLLAGTGDEVLFTFSDLGAAAAGERWEVVLDLGANYKRGKGPLRSCELAVSFLGDGVWRGRTVERLRFRKPLSIAIDPALVVGGRLVVRVERQDDRFDLYLRADRAEVRRPGGSLAVNLLRTFGLLWLRAVLVVAMAVLASALFSGPVAVLFAFFLILLCQIAGFIERYAATVVETARMVALYGAEALGGHSHDGHSHGLEAPSAATVQLATLGGRLASVLPHLEDFDTRAELLRGLTIPPGTLPAGAQTTVLFAAALMVIATLVFRRRSLP